MALLFPQQLWLANYKCHVLSSTQDSSGEGNVPPLKPHTPEQAVARQQGLPMIGSAKYATCGPQQSDKT